MTINEARLIRELKRRCSYRRLAAAYYPEEHDGHGNEGWGEELCFEAFMTLYPDLGHPFELKPENVDDRFNKENKSYIGDFYWWE